MRAPSVDSWAAGAAPLESPIAGTPELGARCQRDQELQFVLVVARGGHSFHTSAVKRHEVNASIRKRAFGAASDFGDSELG